MAPGTYFGTLNLLGREITLRSSGGHEVTTIDAQQAGSALLCVGGEGPATLLDGFQNS